MKVWHFSEMAYPHLPEPEEYESIRNTLPNKYYDPALGADLYHRLLDEWQVADELGIDIMVNEHHQTPTCVNPCSPLIVGILARTTKKARLLILGNPIANRSQPMRVAEEMAMIDVISRGRLECGFVRSVPYEVSAGNSNPVRMNERMWEAHDFIIKAWTTHDGPFSFEGEFFHHRLVNLWPRPYQQPHPPVWISSTSVPGARTVGEKGYVLAVFLSGYANTPKVYQSYAEGWKAAGRGQMPLDRLAYSALVHVADTDDEARAGTEKLAWYFTHNKAPMHFKNPPGYVPVATNVRALKNAHISEHPADLSLDSLIQQGLIFCGNPDTVYEQIARFYKHVGGFGNLLAMGQAGFLGHAETVKSLRLLSSEVMPRLQDLHKPTKAMFAA